MWRCMWRDNLISSNDTEGIAYSSQSLVQQNQTKNCYMRWIVSFLLIIDNLYCYPYFRSNFRHPNIISCYSMPRPKDVQAPYFSELKLIYALHHWSLLMNLDMVSNFSRYRVNSLLIRKHPFTGGNIKVNKVSNSDLIPYDCIIIQNLFI